MRDNSDPADYAREIVLQATGDEREADRVRQLIQLARQQLS